MEWVILFATVVLVAWLWNRDMARARRTGKRPCGSATGAFAVMNELFQPNAHEVLIIAEANKEAAVELPGAPDPLLPKIETQRNPRRNQLVAKYDENTTQPGHVPSSWS